MSDCTITELNRDCIACPTIWNGRTQNGDKVQIRYRWGDLSIRCDESDPTVEDEIFKTTVGDELDGHMTLYDLREILENSPIEFEVTLPTEFYDTYSPDECEFVLFGNFVDSLTCTECGWSIDGEKLEEFEYETVLPPVCLECGSEYEVTEKTPDHLKELQEQAEETSRDEVIDNIQESVEEN